MLLICYNLNVGIVCGGTYTWNALGGKSVRFDPGRMGIVKNMYLYLNAGSDGTGAVPYKLPALIHKADTTIVRWFWRIGIDALHDLIQTADNNRIVPRPLADWRIILVAAPDLDIAKLLLHCIAGNGIGEIGILRHNMADRCR